MPRWKTKEMQRRRRHLRIRNRITGTSERPRLAVYRSLNHIYAQVIDDTQGKTLTAASSASKELASKIKQTKGKIEQSRFVGELVAEKAAAAGIKQVAFDRGGYLYHGRIRALAEGARKGGLEF